MSLTSSSSFEAWSFFATFLPILKKLSRARVLTDRSLRGGLGLDSTSDRKGLRLRVLSSIAFAGLVGSRYAELTGLVLAGVQGGALRPECYYRKLLE